MDIFGIDNAAPAPTDVIEVYVGPTWFKVACNRNGVLKNGVSISRYVKDNLQQREWNPNLRTFINTYNYTAYEPETGMALFPRYALDDFLSYLGDDNRVKQVHVSPVTPGVMKAKSKSAFSPREEQKSLIEFLLADRYFKPISAATGIGKTFVTINSMTTLGMPVLLILGSLIDQWIKSIKQFTTIKRDDIYIVQGFDSLKTLWEMLENGFKPKVTIFSTRTLSLYAVTCDAPYNTLKSFAELQKKIGFGTKVIDECHTNFYANTQIDLRCNIRNNIYLSATYQRSDPTGRRIFDLVYPPELRFGDQFGTKYTTVNMIQYHLGIHTEVMRRFKVAKGYLHAKYEGYLLKKRYYFTSYIQDVLLPVIRMYWIVNKKEGQRLLILCQTKAFVQAVADAIRFDLKDYKLKVYFSGDKSKEGNVKNLEADIIVSTMKSCSTGVDIKGLKTCINTVSFASEPQAAQTMGRLRQIPGEDTFFVDLWNGEVPTHFHHKRSRLGVYRTKALKVIETVIR